MKGEPPTSSLICMHTFIPHVCFSFLSSAELGLLPMEKTRILQSLKSNMNPFLGSRAVGPTHQGKAWSREAVLSASILIQ